MTPTLSPEEVEALIGRLRARKIGHDSVVWEPPSQPDPDCIAAADALADLRRQLDEARETAHLNYGCAQLALKHRDDAERALDEARINHREYVEDITEHCDMRDQQIADLRRQLLARELG